MNILIDINKKILSQLEELEQIICDKEIYKSSIKKIEIVYDDLSNISDTLTNLNLNVKLDNHVELTDDDKEYLKNQKKTNQLIAKIMPAMVLLSMQQDD